MTENNLHYLDALTDLYNSPKDNMILMVQYRTSAETYTFDSIHSIDRKNMTVTIVSPYEDSKYSSVVSTHRIQDIVGLGYRE